MKTGMVLVSHSEKLADGLKDILDEMKDDSVEIVAAGGTGDGHIGTNAMRIMEQIETLSDVDDILLFADLGSSILSSEMAIDMLDPEIGEKVQIVDVPIVEGAFLAVVNAPAAPDAAAVIKAAQDARVMKKIND